MRILFITSTRIGDAIVSSGLIEHLVNKYPDARFTIACGELPSVLFENAPGLERIIIIRKKKFSAHWLALWAQAVGEVWDIVIDLRASAISYLLWTKERYVYQKSESHKVVAASNALGLAEPIAPKIYANARVREKAKEIIGEGPVIAIGPTANWIGKTWPAERFAELITRLCAEGGPFQDSKVLVLGASHERDMAEPVLKVIDQEKCLDQIGKLDLLSAYACLELCDFYIGNDSGLMHLAAAAGIPTLGLFGPSRDELYGPWGLFGDSVRGASVEEIRQRDFAFDAQACYMNDLSVDSVESKVHELWSRWQARPSQSNPL